MTRLTNSFSQKLGKFLFIFLAFAVALFILGVPSKSTKALSTTPSLDIIRQVSWSFKAVGPDDVTYATPNTGGARENELWRSLDEGATWSPVYTWPSGYRIYGMNRIASGTMIAVVSQNIGGKDTSGVWRSTDGLNWTLANLDSQPFYMPNDPCSYHILTPKSIAYDSQYSFIGSYNNCPYNGEGTSIRNYVWRSSDDGQNWSIAPGFAEGTAPSLAFRHIHGLNVDPSGRLWVLAGDGHGGIWYSDDEGQTFDVRCSVFACVGIDLAWGKDGRGYYGTDTPYQQNVLYSFDPLAYDFTNALGNEGLLDLPSYGIQALGSGTILIGQTREAGMSQQTFSLYAFTSSKQLYKLQTWNVLNTVSPYMARVQFQYSDGNFPIQVNGYGLYIARLLNDGNTSPPPTPTTPSNLTLPIISGTTTKDQVLSGTDGTWSGTPTPTITERQWLRCDTSGNGCSSIPGATGSSYTLTSDDMGHTLRLRATASNSAGSPSVDSAQSSVIADTPVVPPATGSTQYDTSSAYTGYGTSTTQNFTVGNNSNRMLMVFVEREYRTGVNNVASVNYNGVSLTKLVGAGATSSANNEIWYLLNPDTGTHPLALSFGGGTSMNYRWGVSSYYNVKQVAPSNVYSSGQSGVYTTGSFATSASRTLTGTLTGSLVVDFLGGSGISLTTTNSDIGQTKTLSITDRPGIGTGYGSITSSYKAGGGDITTKETLTTGQYSTWAYMQVELAAQD